MTKEDIKKVKSSFARCFMNDKNLIDVFYQIFLNSHPDIGFRFKNTNFDQQKLLLRQGINCMIMYSEGAFAGSFCMEEIKVSHNRKHYNIDPRMYPYWKSSLLEALKLNDPELNEELIKLWQQVIDDGIDFISKGY